MMPQSTIDGIQNTLILMQWYILVMIMIREHIRNTESKKTEKQK